jgi:hypothetical protein
VRRIEGPAAIGFTVAFVAGLVLTNVPDQGETRQQAIDFYNSAGEKTRVLVAALARSGALPRWLGWSGFVVAAACLFGFTFVPLLVFATWMLALGAVFTASQGE